MFKNLAMQCPKAEMESDDYVFANSSLLKSLSKKTQQNWMANKAWIAISKEDLPIADYRILLEEKPKFVEIINKLLDDIDKSIIEELTEAGIKYKTCKYLRGDNSRTEVPTSVLSNVCGWKFERAWRYWICEGPGIPPDIAEKFNEKWGGVCRVGGNAGGVSPLKEYRGFAVPYYHIDTQEGLNAFVELLKSIERK